MHTYAQASRPGSSARSGTAGRPAPGIPFANGGGLGLIELRDEIGEAAQDVTGLGQVAEPLAQHDQGTARDSPIPASIA
jgi:hypothetical protein